MDYNIRIANGNGKIYYSGRLQDNIDTYKYPEGIYFINFSSPKNNFSIKFLKKH